jgi:hypothetical protein
MQKWSGGIFTNIEFVYYFAPSCIICDLNNIVDLSRLKIAILCNSNKIVSFVTKINAKMENQHTHTVKMAGI